MVQKAIFESKENKYNNPQKRSSDNTVHADWCGHPSAEWDSQGSKPGHS